MRNDVQDANDVDIQAAIIIDFRMAELPLAFGQEREREREREGECYKRSILLIGLSAEWQLIITLDNNK